MEIESPLFMSIEQFLSQDEERLVLYLRTEWGSPYSGQNIKVLSAVRTNSIEINGKSIIPHKDSWGHVLAPADAFVDLGSVPSGYYQFLVAIRDTLIVAGLEVSDDTYSISNFESEWIIINRPAVRRLPPDTMWGRIVLYQSAPGGDSVIQSFLDSLAILGADETSLPAGYYGSFWSEDHFAWQSFLVDSTGTNSPCPSRYERQCNHFFRHYTGEHDPLRDLAQRFTNRFNADHWIHISIMHSNGEGFYELDLGG